MTSARIPAVLARFPEIWLLDFEFIAASGERPDPVCCVALELRTGRELRFWDDELRRAESPISEDALMIAYYASAELGCFQSLGWPMPRNVLDLYTEFRVFENGRGGLLGIRGTSLLAALAYFGLSHLDPEVKAGWRERILRGRPYAVGGALRHPRLLRERCHRSAAAPAGTCISPAEPPALA